MLEFENQNVIVTGGTRGIGAAITKNFLEQGARVFATYKSSHQKAEEFKTSLGELAEKLELFSFDVSDEKACEDFFSGLKDKDIELHVLINNAGIRRDGLLATMKSEDFDAVINTNLKSTFTMSKHAVLMMMRKRYGRIINISSISGSLGLNGQANYSASKAGQIALSKSLAKEVAKRNITVNNVAPGFIETDILDGLPEKLIEEYKKDIPMKRFGQAQEVANVVSFLASKKASYVTGATLEVSGGLNG